MNHLSFHSLFLCTFYNILDASLTLISVFSLQCRNQFLSAFCFFFLHFCVSVQNLQLCPHSLQVFCCCFPQKTMLTRHWSLETESQQKNTTLQTQSVIKERDFEFTGLHTSEAETLLFFCIYFFVWNDQSLFLVLNSLIPKTTETTAGSFRAGQSETLSRWVLLVISYQLPQYCCNLSLKGLKITQIVPV